MTLSDNILLSVKYNYCIFWHTRWYAYYQRVVTVTCSSKYLELSAVLLYVISNVYWIEIRLKDFAPRVGVVVNMTTDPGA